jgi:hypothetical protein
LAPPSFSQSSGDATLYWLTGAATPAGYGVGLLLPAGTPSPPSTIDLAGSWTQYPGLYVMTAAQPSGPTADFVAALRGLQAARGPLLRFAWIDSAAPDPADGAAAAILVEQAANAATGTVAAPVDVRFGAYRLGIAAGQTIAPTADGFVISGGDAWAFSLRSATSVWTLSAPSGSPSTVVSLAADSAGCILLDLALPQDHEASGVDDYVRLDAGFRFAIDDTEAPVEGLLRSLAYPLFEGVPEGGVALEGSFDPALPLDATRTRLAYAAGAAEHGSYYRSPLGHGVALTPGTGGDLPAGLAFHRRPGTLLAGDDGDPLYLGPVGPFTASVAGGSGDGAMAASPAARLACGLGGTEYFGLSQAEAATVTFAPGGGAYAKPQALDGLATSPWAAVTPATGAEVWYYAQPDSGPVHRVRATGDASLVPYLVYLELPAGSVDATQTGAYPLVPYAGVSASELEPYRELEARVLAPRRRATLAPTPLTPAATTTVTGATPQGLLSEFTSDLASWRVLSFVPLPAAPPDPPPPPALALNNVRGDLRQAVQANELFVVAVDPTQLLAAADLNYWLDDTAFGDLTALPDGQRPPAEVITKLQASGRTPQVGAAAFETMLKGFLTTDEQQWIPTVEKYAAYFEIVIAGWRFRVSPLLWGALAEFPTTMILKFATSDLRSLVADPATWTWPAAGGDATATSERVLGIIDGAREQLEAAAGRPHPLDFFVETVCGDPAWTGVVFLDAQVPFSSMPEELRGLASGIDASRFRAHHVGLSVTPVHVDDDTRALTLGPSSFFGLIDYESLEDIAHTSDDFDFKVLQLQVLFRNSAVVDFASRIELFVSRLFDEGVSLLDSEHYNNLILLGSYQRQHGTGHYVFATPGASTFSSGGGVVDEIEVDRAQFNTTAATSDGVVHSRFLMWGRLRFHQLDGLDLFSFGYALNEQGGRAADGHLAFSGLAVDMSFDESDPTGRKLALDARDVAFDASASRPRPTSFFARFPLTVATLVHAGAGQTPKDLGFEPVETPLDQPALTGGWWGIAFTVDLGTLGALAAEAGLVVTLLAAWGPTSDRAGVNVGLRLPGTQSLKGLPAIEGVLQLGFQSIVLEAPGARALPPDPAYVMRLRHFSMGLLGWRFPPGQADIYLFADPETGPHQRGALGWYAAYLEEGK